LQRALAKDPDQRYPDARQFALALRDAVLRAEATASGAVNGPEQTTLPAWVSADVEVNAVSPEERGPTEDKGPFAEELERLERLYRTRGGYPLAVVDSAAGGLLELFQTEFERQVESIRPNLSNEGGLGVERSTSPAIFEPTKGTHRALPVGSGSFKYLLRSKPPFSDNVAGAVQVEVPIDCAPEDRFLVRWLDTGVIKVPPPEVVAEAQAIELIPEQSTDLKERISEAGAALLRRVLRDLAARTAERRKQIYGAEP
jgi:hypothetical protein